MKKYIQNSLALSDEGVRDFFHSVFWATLWNLCLIFPAALAFYFIREQLSSLQGEGGGHTDMVLYLALALVLGLIMYLIAVIQYNSCYTKTYEESARMRISLAEKLRKLPLAFFGKRDIADLSSTIMEDATQIEQLFSHAVPQLFASLLSASFFSLLLLIFQWQMALAMLWVVPAAFLIFYLSRNFQKKSHTRIHGQKLAIAGSLQEGLDCIGELKSCNYEKKYAKELATLLDTYEKTLITDELLLGALLNLSHILLKLGLVSVALTGAWLFASGSLDMFTWLVFMIASASIYTPFTGAIEQMAALLYLSVRINRKKEMDAMPIQQGKTTFTPAHFDIEFTDVFFSYDKKAQTIDGLSFTARQGEVTALVGPSGGGKSTTARLAARFWDIDRGKITLGGEDIAGIDPETLLQYYSIVFQDVTLFNFSIMENIRLGKKDATDEEVLRAAKLAQCDAFVGQLPQGYDTLIGENGERLSGGERQRISIARAILKDAPIILLDEATASLDAENETRIQRALSELVKDKTVLLIAHRMRTVRNADKIVLLREGRLAESGTPQELLQAGGLFAAMNS